MSSYEAKQRDIKQAEPKVKKKEGQNDYYIGVIVLGTVFVLGVVCGRVFGNASLESSSTQEIISAIQARNEKRLLKTADIENLKQLVLELKSPHSKDPKDVSEMSHKEAMESMSQPVNPNAYRDFILDKIYTFFVLVLLLVFLLFCTWAGAFDRT